MAHTCEHTWMAHACGAHRHREHTQLFWCPCLIHYKKYVNLGPSLLVTEWSLFSICDLFLTKKRWSKTGGRKLKFTTFSVRRPWKATTKTKGRWSYDILFWSLALCPGHVGSDVAKLRPNEKVVDKNQPGPFRCFRWAEPNNSAFFC